MDRTIDSWLGRYRPQGTSMDGYADKFEDDLYATVAQQFYELEQQGLSDQAFKYLVDFYQQQLRHYAEQLADEQDGRTIGEAFLDALSSTDQDEPSPRDLAWDDVERMASLYQRLGNPYSLPQPDYG